MNQPCSEPVPTFPFQYPTGVSSTAAPDFPFGQFTERHLRGLIREIVREELRLAGVIKDATRNER